MDREGAETAVTLSALTVFGVFAYRKVVEPEVATQERSNNLIRDYQAVFGSGPPLEWGQFLKAAGALYIGIAILAAASPQIGGAAAILIASGAILGNGVALNRDLHSSPVEKTADVGSVRTFAKPGGISTLPQSGFQPGQIPPTLGK